MANRFVCAKVQFRQITDNKHNTLQVNYLSKAIKFIIIMNDYEHHNRNMVST